MKSLLILLLLPVLSATAQTDLGTRAITAGKQLNCPMPDADNPVTLNAALLVDGPDSLAIIVKVLMARGWHIYQYVPSTKPFIQMAHILKLPDGIFPIGPWEKEKPFASADDPGVLIYKNEVVFIQKAVKSSASKKGGIIQAGLYFQACNRRQCMPPIRKTFDLKY
jgi:hypothetical protein